MIAKLGEESWKAHVAQLEALGAKAGPKGRAAVQAFHKAIRDLQDENERYVQELVAVRAAKKEVETRLAAVEESRDAELAQDREREARLEEALREASGRLEICRDVARRAGLPDLTDAALIAVTADEGVRAIRAVLESLPALASPVAPPPAAPPCRCAAQEEIARMVQTAEDRYRSFGATGDPRVASLGDEIGYGNLMDTASRMWRARLERYGPGGGEFVVGSCMGTLRSMARNTEDAPPCRCAEMGRVPRPSIYDRIIDEDMGDEEDQ